MSTLCNLGGVDRVIRASAGVALLAIALFGAVGSFGAVAMGLAGVILLVTAATRFCPLYRLFGLSTCDSTLRTR